MQLTGSPTLTLIRLSSSLIILTSMESSPWTPYKAFLLGVPLTLLPLLCPLISMSSSKLFSKIMKTPCNPGILMVMTFGLLGKFNNFLFSFLFVIFGLTSVLKIIICNCSYGSGQWTPASRNSYNLVDAVTRHTAQVMKN